MVTFLELPRELRDKIISLVLSHHEDAPKDVSDPTTGRALPNASPDLSPPQTHQ